MIASESFKKFRIIDIGAIIVLAITWLVLSTFVNGIAGPQASYIFSLLILTVLLSLTVHLIRKAGSATLFCIAGASLTFWVNDLGATGINKFIVLIIAGIIFEIVYLILTFEVKNVQFDVLAGTACAAASIPLTTGLLISTGTTLQMMPTVINLMLVSFFIGIIGTVISFLLWYHLKTTKLVLKFEYMQ